MCSLTASLRKAYLCTRDAVTVLQFFIVAVGHRYNGVYPIHEPYISYHHLPLIASVLALKVGMERIWTLEVRYYIYSIILWTKHVYYWRNDYTFCNPRACAEGYPIIQMRSARQIQYGIHMCRDLGFSVAHAHMKMMKWVLVQTT